MHLRRGIHEPEREPARGRDQEEAVVVLLEADAHAREAQCHSPALDGEQAVVEGADDVG
jgi:hypothetical protein